MSRKKSKQAPQERTDISENSGELQALLRTAALGPVERPERGGANGRAGGNRIEQERAPATSAGGSGGRKNRAKSVRQGTSTGEPRRSPAQGDTGREPFSGNARQQDAAFPRGQEGTGEGTFPSSEVGADSLFIQDGGTNFSDVGAGEALPGMDAAPIGKDEIRRAREILQKYKTGKANLERRIIENEQWWKLRHWEQIRGNQPQREIEPTSAWLFNSIANKHADAMDNYPEPCVLPREASDRKDAQQLGSILPVILEQNGYEQVYSDVWWYKLKNGTGVKGVFWDKDKNGIGDITITKVDLLNLFWEPGITDIQQSQHLFHVRLVDNELLQRQYPQLTGKLGNASLEVSQYIYDDAVDTSGKSAVVDWYYKLQSGGRRRLHYVKFVDDELLYASENDPAYRERGFYDHGQYPFVFDTLFVEEGTPAGFGYIDVMKDTQMYIDKLGQAIIKNALLSSRKRYFIRQDGSVNEKEFADASNELVHVQGNLGEDSLREIKTDPLGSINVQIMQLKIDELKETSGNRDFSQGGTTGGVTAASAIAALQEAGSKLSRDMLKASYRAFTQECYLILELIRQFYDEPRFFRITGQMGQEEFIGYDNSRIRPQEQGMAFGQDLGMRMPVFDIKVRPQKANAFSVISQNELAKEFYGMGFFNPQMADQALACMEMMDFEGKEMVMQKVAANGTMLQQLTAMQQQLAQMTAILQQAGLIPPMTGGGAQPSEQAGAAPSGGAGASGGDDPLGRAVTSASNTQADTARQRALGQAGVR